MKFERANLVVATYKSPSIPLQALVGVKKRGAFEARTVFPGGKVNTAEQSGWTEDKYSAASREFTEETTLAAGKLRLAGRLCMLGDRRAIIDVFHTELDSPHTPPETEELELSWRPLVAGGDEAFYDGMPPDVPYWFTEIFTTGGFRAYIHTDNGQPRHISVIGHQESIYDYRREYCLQES